MTEARERIEYTTLSLSAESIDTFCSFTLFWEGNVFCDYKNNFLFKYSKQ